MPYAFWTVTVVLNCKRLIAVRCYFRIISHRLIEWADGVSVYFNEHTSFFSSFFCNGKAHRKTGLFYVVIKLEKRKSLIETFMERGIRQTKQNRTTTFWPPKWCCFYKWNLLVASDILKVKGIIMFDVNSDINKF